MRVIVKVRLNVGKAEKENGERGENSRTGRRGRFWKPEKSADDFIFFVFHINKIIK